MTRHLTAALVALARPAITVAIGVAAGMVVLGGLAGLLLGLMLGVGFALWQSRQPSAAQRRWHAQFGADLPFTIDLVAAALRAGSSPDVAAGSVADAVGGPVGMQLLNVARALRLGIAPAEAWGYLGSGDAIARLVRAAARTSQSGAAFARALARVADDLRADMTTTAQTRAHRASVLVVLPLGLCFLPAFMLTGLMPVMLAVVGGVLNR